MHTIQFNRPRLTQQKNPIRVLSHVECQDHLENEFAPVKNEFAIYCTHIIFTEQNEHLPSKHDQSTLGIQT